MNREEKEAFNSLFEMLARAYQTRRDELRVGPFNSLFEMQFAAQLCVFKTNSFAFNSLFEMLSVSRRQAATRSSECFQFSI